MNLILDPSPDDGRTVTGAFVVLAKWYAAHSVVRRLWAIRESQRMRIIVKLEPTRDGDDIYPAWLANGHEWAHEDLQPGSMAFLSRSCPGMMPPCRLITTTPSAGTR
jgi:hypothetical protein